MEADTIKSTRPELFGGSICTNSLIVSNIIRSITTFEDLKSCREVNRIFNTESRRHFLSKSYARFSTVSRMSEYIKYWSSSKGYSNFSIRLNSKWFDEDEKRAIWHKFFNTFGHEIEALTLYVRDDNRWQWDSFLAILPLLTNMKSLHMDLSRPNQYLTTPLYYFYVGVLPYDHNVTVQAPHATCVSLKKIKISTNFYESDYSWGKDLSEWIVHAFPNLEEFESDAAPLAPTISINFMRQLVEKPELVKNLTSFAFSAYKYFPLGVFSTFPYLLKELRLDMPAFNFGKEFKAVLEHFSGTLESLSVHIMDSFDPERVPMPIMPKLKHFCARYFLFDRTIHVQSENIQGDNEEEDEECDHDIHDHSDFLYSRFDFDRRVHITFNFVNGALNYALQFPILESLKIESGYCGIRGATLEIKEKEIFDQYFHEDAICQSVKRLEVTYPKKDSKNYDEFVSRISKVFPNAENDPVLFAVRKLQN